MCLGGDLRGDPAGFQPGCKLGGVEEVPIPLADRRNASLTHHGTEGVPGVSDQAHRLSGRQVGFPEAESINNRGALWWLVEVHAG